MTVLVTGAGGFVGCHVVEAVARAFPQRMVVAADVAAPDSVAMASFRQFGEQVAFVSLDVTDRSAVTDLFVLHRPQAVVHAAAITPSPQQEAADPVHVLDVNLGGLANILHAGRAGPPLGQVLFLSSTGVFGPSVGDRTVDEDADPRPTILYGIAKRAGEDLLRRWSELTGVAAASLRLGAIFGRHERPTPHRGRMSAVGRLLAAGSEGRTVAVHGRGIVRDWLDGDDLGGAVVRMLSAPRFAAPVYHVTGERVTFGQIVSGAQAGGLSCRWIEDARDADVAMVEADRRADASPARFEAEFGPLASRPVAEAVAALAGAQRSRSASTGVGA